MNETRVHCPSCHRNRKVIDGRYDDHFRSGGRQGGRCGQSGELVVAVSERAA